MNISGVPMIGHKLDSTLLEPIKAIPTAYAGRSFLSRSEARWAVFFDTLGIAWEYEKQPYTLGDGTNYSPDFWLPALSCWYEVKGAAPTDLECHKADLLAQGTGHPVYVAWGDLSPAWAPTTGIDVWYPEGIRVGHQFWAEWLGRPFLSFMGWLPRDPGQMPICAALTPRILAAYRAATSERFGY